MRILVCGGRNFRDSKLLEDTLSQYTFTVLITGMDKGADSLAWYWAKNKSIPVLEFFPNWAKYRKEAGFVRNTQMLVEGKPDLVIAFPGGSGTDMMCRIARRAGVEVVNISPRV